LNLFIWISVGEEDKIDENQSNPIQVQTGSATEKIQPKIHFDCIKS